MKKVIAAFAFVLFTCLVHAQNLVPNPSFEIRDSCPDGPSELGYAPPWFQPSWGTPDYLNSCTINWHLGVPLNYWGFQNAHTGQAYAGFFACLVYADSIIPNIREYCEVKLNSPLQAGINYFVTFFVSLGDSMYFATDAASAFFSNDSVKNSSGYFLSPIIPQVENTSGNFLSDKIGWTKVSGKFTATGGEQFLTIGNFKDYINTNTLSVRSGWTISMGVSDYTGGYYYLDDVCVSTDSLYAQTWTGTNINVPNSKIRIYPNPATNYIVVEGFSSNGYFSITNILNQPIAKGKLIENYSLIDVTTIPNGAYFIIINNEEFYKIIINH